MGIGSGQAVLLNVLMNNRSSPPLNSVCEYGAQVPLASELKSLLRDTSGIKTAADLYNQLGFSKYVTFDINGEYNALVYDINNDIPTTYGYNETFDVVTNFGTSEHCFNQYQVFKNIHNSCRVGGHMLHTVPTQGWGGHCFFRYDRNFFLDLSDANGYEIIFLDAFLRLKSYRNKLKHLQHIGSMMKFIEEKILQNNYDGDNPFYKTDQISDALKILGLRNGLFNITAACIFKKTKESEFSVPIQGMYQKAIIKDKRSRSL